MKQVSYVLCLAVWLLVVVPFNGLAQEVNEERKEDGGEGRNELALFLGGTTNKDATAITFGLDYQYRLTPLVGIGGLIDHAAGDIKSTLLGAAAFLHFLSWEITLAPAVEFVGDETNFTFRVGLAYEISLPAFSISPALNLDTERGGELSVVYGLSFGIEF